jgi:hypothetical protein
MLLVVIVIRTILLICLRREKDTLKQVDTYSCYRVLPQVISLRYYLQYRDRKQDLFEEYSANRLDEPQNLDLGTSKDSNLEIPLGRVCLRPSWHYIEVSRRVKEETA